MELPRERVSSTPSPRHVPRAVAGTGGYRYRSNTKFIEWWHRTKNTARESANPFQRYKLLKSVMGSGRVGSGWAAHTEISPLNHRRTRSALRAPLVIINQYDALIGDRRAGEEAPSCEGGVHMRTCRCTLHLTCVSLHLMGRSPHTKFERNPPNRLQDMEKGCARAHVQMHPTSDLCKALI